MFYFAKIVKNEEDAVFEVYFPDLPGCFSMGETLEEAVRNANDALNGLLEANQEDGIPFPSPKIYEGAQYYPIQVDASITVAAEIRNLRGTRKRKDVAKALGCSVQAYGKYEHWKTCNPTVRQLSKITKVLGKHLDIRFD